MDPRRAGTGYLSLPDSGRGPGVLVLPSWWGPGPTFNHWCDRLAGAGFVALSPDLFGGEPVHSEAEAAARLGRARPDEIAHLCAASLHTLLGLDATVGEAVGVVGFSSGASMALWLAARAAGRVAAVVAAYGSQDIDFAAASCAFQLHFAGRDPYVEDDQRVLLEADLRLLDKQVEAYDYPGTGPWFAEADRSSYDVEAAATLWSRASTFLSEHLCGA